MDLAEESQAGIAGADVVGREPHPGRPALLDIPPQLVEVFHRLAFRQLEHDSIKGDPVASEDPFQIARSEETRFERPRREVDAEIRVVGELPDAGRHDLQAEQIQLDDLVGRLRRGEQRARIGEGRAVTWSDKPLESHRPTRLQREDRLVDRPERSAGQHLRHVGRQLRKRARGRGILVVAGVEGDDGRPAVTLAPVQSRVGLAKELVRLGARFRVGADTDRQRERLDWCTGVSATERRGQDPPSDGETDLEVGIRQEDRELVPTDPEGSIIPAHDRRRDLTHGDEQTVPRRVPMTVVDGLQPVDVEQHEGEWRALPAGLLELARQLVLEGAMVAEAGQAVEQGGPPGLAVELMHLGPFDVECRRIAQDSAGDDRHECRHREPTDREDQHRDQLTCLIRVPESLDRGRAHQDAERHEQPHRQSTSDPAQSLGGRRDRRGRGRHGHALSLFAPASTFYAGEPCRR